MSLTPLTNIHSQISPRIFEKIRNDPNEILRGPGDTDLWKKPEVENLVSDSLLRLHLTCGHCTWGLCKKSRVWALFNSGKSHFIIINLPRERQRKNSCDNIIKPKFKRINREKYTFCITKSLKKWPHPLLRPKTNHTCNQKPNLSRETVL